MALLAIECTIDDVARVSQRGGELPVKVWIVLDNEKAQSATPVKVRRAMCPLWRLLSAAPLCHHAQALSARRRDHRCCGKAALAPPCQASGPGRHAWRRRGGPGVRSPPRPDALSDRDNALSPHCP